MYRGCSYTSSIHN